LGENHEKGRGFGLHQLLNRYSPSGSQECRKIPRASSRQRMFFLNPEVRSNEVKVQIVTMTDWIKIVRSVPRCVDIEELAAVRHLAAHVQPTH
jgi:hypothetical protein